MCRQSLPEQVNSSLPVVVVLTVLLLRLAPVRQVIIFRRLDRITTNCCDRRLSSVAGSFQYRSDAFLGYRVSTSKVILIKVPGIGSGDRVHNNIELVLPSSDCEFIAI